MIERRAGLWWSIVAAIITLNTITAVVILIRINYFEDNLITSQEKLMEALQHLPLSSGVSSGMVGLPIGSEAPNFELYDLAENPVTLNSFRENKILLIFSSPKCSACQEIYPDIEEFDKTNSFMVLMISLGTTDENIALKNDYNFNFPILIWDHTVAQNYRVPGTPFFYLIDENGLIIKTGGRSAASDLRSFVNTNIE